MLPRSILEPQWLISVDAHFNFASYRVRMDWAGRRTLRSSVLPARGTPHYLVLHPSLPFRRKLQGLPPQAKARAVLLHTAADEFPLEEGTASYCLGLRGQEAYVYALPHTTMDLIAGHGFIPDIILVGQSEALDESDCLAALEAYGKFGPALALNARRRPLSRPWLLLNLPLSLGAIAAISMIAWQVVGNDPLSQLLVRQRVDLRKQTATLTTQYSATERMLNSNRLLASIHEDPDADLSRELARLWQTLPAGNAIRSIEYKQHHLIVTGSGPDADRLLEAGFLEKQISSETIGSITRFKAERYLGHQGNRI